MKRTYLFGTMMAFSLAAASVGAQQDRPTPSSSDRQDKNVVVTGCLKSGAPMATGTASGTAGTIGTTGTSGTTASGAGRSSGFILTDAKLTTGLASAPGAATATPTGSATGTATGSTGSTAGTTGASGSAVSGVDKDKAKSFALIGGTPSELQGYINSKVEISGTIDSSGNPAIASGASATGGTAPGSTGSTGSTASGTGATMSGMSHASDHPKLRVTSVRQIAASCDAGQQ